ncbi:MAG: hypothetical protein NTX35_20140, partial [Verrucomicrobia bacterium]|nr:hypothetical protein [Verrucomicrobiota bacterium]
MNTKIMTRSLLAVVALSLFNGCALTNGVKPDGSYATPDGALTCKLPESLIGLRVDQQSQPGAHAVSF